MHGRHNIKAMINKPDYTFQVLRSLIIPNITKIVYRHYTPTDWPVSLHRAPTSQTLFCLRLTTPGCRMRWSAGTYVAHKVHDIWSMAGIQCWL